MTNEFDDLGKLEAALAQRDALVRALEQVADPLVLDVNGVGIDRALNLIHRMAEIAKDALANVGGRA